jgi:hypothetical protein
MLTCAQGKRARIAIDKARRISDVGPDVPIVVLLVLAWPAFQNHTAILDSVVSILKAR